MTDAGFSPMARQHFGDSPLERGESIVRTDYILHNQAEKVLALLTEPNRLVMRVAMHTGLRVGDVLALRTADLAPRMCVREQKTGKVKRIGLPKKLLADLRAQAGEEFVFPSRCDASKHRSRQAVWKDVKRAAAAFRMPQNVAPHSFRKLYAVDLLAKYGDIERVQRALNHSDAATTLIYAMSDKLMQNR